MKIINAIKCEFIKGYTWSNIIMIILLLSVSVVGLTEITYLSNRSYNYQYENSDESNYQYYKKEYQSNPTIENAIYLKFYENAFNMNKQLQKMNIVPEDNWQYYVLDKTKELENDVFIANQIIKNPNDPFFVELKNETYSMDNCQNVVISLLSKNVNELVNVIKEGEEEIKTNKLLIEENKYYKYIETIMDSLNDEDKEYYQILIDNKVADENHFLSLGVKQRFQILYNSSYGKTYDERDSYSDGFNNYQNYIKYRNVIEKSQKEKLAIIEYSLKNNLKHDITFSFGVAFSPPTYATSKTAVNQILNLSIVVAIIVILTSSGIIINEYKDGTDKLLLTLPIKRWKVLLSKFLYLIIHSYIIWFMALVLMVVYAGIRFGFSDLFTPKLIYYHNSVREVNYLLYIIKDILVANIPIIAMISIVLLISAITNNNSLTVVITVALTILSPIMWYLISVHNIPSLAYTFLPYLDYWLVINNFEYYLLSLRVAKVSYGLGIIISLITTIVCYIITNIAYIKKDIKN